MTGKWSSKPKQQNVARVRENQRRHRARTKAYIADIERKLSETQARLNDALIQNSRLISELAKLQASSAKQSDASEPERAIADQATLSIAGIRSHVSLPSHSSTLWNNGEAQLSLVPPLNTTRTSLCAFSPGDQEPYQAGLPLETVSTGSKASTPPSARQTPEQERSNPCSRSSSCCETPSPLPVTLATGSSQGDEDLALLQSDCSDLPPPRLGESTIPCKTAYFIIKQQNYNDTDLSSIKGFLASGFRGATVHEDGCRVESHRVYSIFDIINH